MLIRLVRLFYLHHARSVYLEEVHGCVGDLGPPSKSTVIPDL